MRPRWWTLRSAATTAPSSRARPTSRSIISAPTRWPNPMPPSNTITAPPSRTTVSPVFGDAVPLAMLWT